MTLAYEEAVALVAAMSDKDKAALDRQLGEALKAPWHPDPANGPQQAAYHSKADLLLFGGAAGGGKSELLIGTALTQHTDSVIFRRQAVDLRDIEKRLVGLCGRDGWNGTTKTMRQGRRTIELGHLGGTDAEEAWRGRAHDFIGFDEGAQLSGAKVRFVMGWLRSVDPHQRCRVIIATNPPTGGEGAWIMAWFAPWLDDKFGDPATPGELRWAVTAPDVDGTTVWCPGPEPVKFIGPNHQIRLATPDEIADDDDADVVTPQSRTFIPSSLRDNRFLANSGYRARLQSMPEPLRSQLLRGDFLAGQSDHEWQVIPTAWAKAAQERWRPKPPADSVMSALAVDVAQGGADRTVVQARYGPWFMYPVDRPGTETPTGSEVAALVIGLRRDGAMVIVDFGGGYGGATSLRLGDNEIPSIAFNGAAKTTGRAAGGQLAFVNKRSEVHWRFREALDPDQPHGSPIMLPPDPQLLADLTTPRWKLTANGILIESKEEIRKRLGRSPDKGDAAVMVWSEGEKVMIAKQRKALRVASIQLPKPPVSESEFVNDRGTGWMGRG